MICYSKQILEPLQCTNNTQWPQHCRVEPLILCKYHCQVLLMHNYSNLCMYCTPAKYRNQYISKAISQLTNSVVSKVGCKAGQCSFILP